MTSAVVDARIVVKLFLPEPDSDRAEALLRQLRARGVVATAPLWCRSEVANALLQAVARGSIDPADVPDLLRELPRFLRLDDVPGDVVARAFELAVRLGLRTIYDVQYLALAEAGGGEFWTADERFWRLVRAEFPSAHWLGELG